MATCKVCSKNFEEKLSYDQHYASKHAKKPEAPIQKKSSRKIYFIVPTLLLIMLGYFILSDGKDTQPLENFEFFDLPALGSENASVTLTEYSDFQCPFCGKFFRDTESQIIRDYVDTGKIKFVYKHYPVDSVHPQASLAALASECSSEQGKFWQYHDLLFQNQALLGEKNYKQWAKDLSLNITQFNNCYGTKRYLSKIRADFKEGIDAGVRGTPGFEVNGILISGAQPFSVFRNRFETELAKGT